MRRGRNKAAVAVARKLCVAVWHVMQGQVIGAIERTPCTPNYAKSPPNLTSTQIKTQANETKEAFGAEKTLPLKILCLT